MSGSSSRDDTATTFISTEHLAALPVGIGSLVHVRHIAGSRSTSPRLIRRSYASPRSLFFPKGECVRFLLLLRYSGWYISTNFGDET